MIRIDAAWLATSPLDMRADRTSDGGRAPPGQKRADQLVDLVGFVQLFDFALQRLDLLALGRGELTLIHASRTAVQIGIYLTDFAFCCQQDATSNINPRLR